MTFQVSVWRGGLHDPYLGFFHRAHAEALQRVEAANADRWTWICEIYADDGRRLLGFRSLAELRAFDGDYRNTLKRRANRQESGKP